LKIRSQPLEATSTGGDGVLIEKEAERERLLPQTKPVLEAMAPEGSAFGGASQQGTRDTPTSRMVHVQSTVHARSTERGVLDGVD
jgi:hypothetical protein